MIMPGSASPSARPAQAPRAQHAPSSVKPRKAILSGLAEVDPFRPEFAYVQVADILTAGIQAGRITGRLPAEPDLARALRTSYNTVRRGIGLLRERGLVTTLHGRGNFVTRPAPASAATTAEAEATP
jgi:GntR family transcriptional regulator